MSSTRQKKQKLDRRLRQARSDYAGYVETEALFGCQKPADLLVNEDELAFQIVHQVEELWMKLLAHTLIDLEASLRKSDKVSVSLRRFQRARDLLALMREQLLVLTTMSPRAYSEIRRELGQGSGQESPGYRAVLQHAGDLWPAFVTGWLNVGKTSLRDVYRDPDGLAFVLAEALADLDTGLAEFRHAHLQLVDRMIGLGSRSLKGLPSQDLLQGVNRRCFPELWQLRSEFADQISPGAARQAL
jgi:tryptophan 2,3-dioxygenase